MRELALGEGEGGLQVLPQDGAVSVALDGSQDLGRSKYEVKMKLLERSKLRDLGKLRILGPKYENPTEQGRKIHT